MLIQISFRVDQDQVRIDCEQLDWHRVVQNFMAYDAVKNVIYEAGTNETEYNQRVINDLRQKGIQLTFVHPLAVATFNPVLAREMLRYHAFRALWDTRPNDARLFPWRHTYAIDLWIDGYERLPLGQRQEFEFAVKKLGLLTRIRQIQVNGRSSLTPEFVSNKRRLEFKHSLASLTLFLLFIGGLSGAFIVAKSSFGPLIQAIDKAPNGAILVLLVIVMFAAIFVIGFGIDLIASFAYALLLRPWLPADILRTVFLKASHFLPKHVVNWLSSTLFADASDTL